jgi:hypothetical protein
MDRLAKLMESPVFKKRNLANVNAGGYLFIRKRLAAVYEINDTQTYRPAIIQNEDGLFPAIIMDPGGNRICRSSTGFIISMPALKRHFNMADNQKVILKKYSTKKHKGFLLTHPAGAWNKEPSTH